MDFSMKDLMAMKGFDEVADHDHKEYAEHHHTDSKYAKKGTANAGLALGIVGTALGAWALFKEGGLHGHGRGKGDLVGEGLAVAALLEGKNAELCALRTASENKYSALKDNIHLGEKMQKQISCLEERVSRIEATIPLESKIAKLEQQIAFERSINYTNEKTCKMIKGIVGIPNDTVTVLPGVGRCGVSVEVPAG